MSNTRSLHFDMLPKTAARQGGPARARNAPRTPRLTARLPLRALVLPVSPVALAIALVITLAVTYTALIATVMSYATMTVGFTQSVRDDEAQVAQLEAQYLSAISGVTATDYREEGYQKPTQQFFVPKAPRAALR